jgi:outer membrane protein assembly factor BamB
LDFPLNPPHAENTQGGGDFGIFRERYNGRHTGEDWGITGGPNFGESVHSIGHGVITLADPNGWGADKGTVIVQHSFEDGSKIYSFYGHLDPPSITLVGGECVIRGQKIGEIGRPRTPPHLHFEIRSVFPNQPARGYLPYDPSLAGWKSPSDFIWNNRLTSSPGVLWVRKSEDFYSKGLGLINNDTYAYLEKDMLIALDLSDGKLLWSASIPRITNDILIDVEHPIIYMVARDGNLNAFRAPDQALGPDLEVSALDLLWNRDLNVTGTLTLLALPEGGVAVSAREKLIVISNEGDLSWEVDPFSHDIDWRISNNQNLLTTGGEDSALWSITASDPPELISQPGAKAVLTDKHYVLYSNEGIHLHPPDDSDPTLAHTLPWSLPYSGDMIVLPDGSVIVAHADNYDPRLIALDPDGGVRWDRSYAAVVSGRPLLLMLDNEPYLLLQDASTRFGSSSLYAINIDNAELVQVFNGGPVRMYTSATWVQVVDERRILINLWGSNLVMLDGEAALEAVRGAGGVQ